MGAGKSTLGVQVAERIGRSFVDLDREIELGAGATVPEIFERRGEAAFRELEEVAALELLAANRPAVVALGGGAVKSQAIRAALGEHALTVHVEVDPAVAWRRVGGHGRPLAQDEGSFRALYEERQPLYREAADAVAHTVDELVLAAAGVHVGLGVLERLGELLPGEGPVALVADAHVAGIHGMDAQLALGSRLQTTHEVQVKTVDDLDRLWRSFRLERSATVVAFGGGTTTDLAGFAAATYMRGIDWVPVPTTLVGQVDAAIGGKTAIDIPEGKNLVGAFHWPARVVIDESLLETLPERERRQGMAELVKTRLLAGRELSVRGAAAYKAALCLRDPYDRGPRRWLNLGHTFAHALEAAADFDLPHGEAVALGLLAALRLSGRDTEPVERELSPRPVRVDPERAWQALLRDKKRAGGEINVVLLGNGGPVVEARPADEVRRELDRLIA
jgi:shikimate kinase/3-dehydroquinate synthase